MDSKRDSIAPSKVKEQLSPKELKGLNIKDSNYDINSCFQVIEGRILNTKNNNPISNAKLKLILRGKVVQETFSQSDGSYTIKLLCNKTYDLRISKVGFTEARITFKSDIKTNTLIKKDFDLAEAQCYQTISGRIKSTKGNSLISGAFVSLLKNNKKIKTVETFEDGTYSFSLECYKTYTIEVEKEHYSGNTVMFNTSLVSEMALIKHIALKPILCTKTMSGTVLSKQDNFPIKNASVELSKDGTFIKNTKTNNAGYFSFDLPCNSVYTVSIRKDNYALAMRALETDNNKTVKGNIEIRLKRISCEQTVEGIVRNSHTNAPEQGVLLQLFNAGKLIKTITTTSDGSYSFNTACYKSYKVLTSKQFFIDGTQYFVSGSTNNAIVQKLIKVSPILDFVEVREILMLKVNPLNLTFILNKNELTSALIKELNKVAALMEKYPYIRLEINVHTDSRANDNLNMKLSKQRAEKIIEYLISRDISSDRLTGDGYGETQLLNHCSNGVKCKNYEHLKNRRIEFIVLDE